MYTVRQPITGSWKDGVGGLLFSRHRSPEAAIAAVVREQRRLRKRPGAGHSYVQRYVLSPSGAVIYASGC